MFDIFNRTEYIPYEKTINIKNAPTDESIEILRKMEEACLTKLVTKITIKNNILEYNINIFNDPLKFESTAVVYYILNGKKYILQIDLPDKYESKDIYNVATIVLKRISEEIGKIFTVDIIKEMIDKGLIKNK